MEHAPPLLPLLRSRLQGDLLTLLYLHPESSYSLTEIARHLGSSVPGVHAEVSRLVEAGFLRDDPRVGNVRRVRAATDTPVFAPLVDLLMVTFGPRPVLTDLFTDVEGVDQAYIHGSWAVRYAGHRGAGVPQDVDVLVVGDADLDVLDDLAREAQSSLQRPVNVTRLSQDLWDAADPQPFVRTVRAGEMVELVGPTQETGE